MPANNDTREERQGRHDETIAASIVKRTQQRLRLFAALTIGLWGLSAAAFILVVRGFFVFIYPIMVEWALDVQPEGLEDRVTAIPNLCMISAYTYFGLLTLAAIATILLIGASRRATLRQIHASLADLSEQLKQLTMPGA